MSKCQAILTWQHRRRPRTGGERGAMVVLLALVMVALMGFAALAIDVGNMYAQKAQLQNGADAAVLAIAQDCVKNGLSTCQANAPTKAQTLAAANVNRGLVGVQSPVFPNANSVKVTATAGKNGDGLDLSFAPVLGIPKASVNATASAAWGSPIRGNAVLPVALSQCEFSQYGFRSNTEFVMRYDSLHDTLGTPRQTNWPPPCRSLRTESVPLFAHSAPAREASAGTELTIVGLGKNPAGLGESGGTAPLYQMTSPSGLASANGP